MLQTDYSRYFAACAPASCLLAYDARPGFLQAVTTALGVLSGLNTILRLIIDNAYDWLCRARCDQRLNERKRDRSAAGKGGSAGAASAPLLQLLADDWDRDSDDSDAEYGPEESPSGAGYAAASAAGGSGGAAASVLDWASGGKQTATVTTASVHPLLSPPSTRSFGSGSASATGVDAATLGFAGGSLRTETRTGPMRLPSLSPGAAASIATSVSTSAATAAATAALYSGPQGGTVTAAGPRTATAASTAAFFAQQAQLAAPQAGATFPYAGRP